MAQIFENGATFALKKAIKAKNGGLDIAYTMQYTDGLCVTNRIVSTRIIHPDLERLFAQLEPIAAKVFTLPNTDSIAVIGISFAGKAENYGCAIISTFFTDALQATNIVTPHLHFHKNNYGHFYKNNYGFEHELEAIATAIEYECYQYLFEDKEADLQAFHPDINTADNE